MNKKLEFKDGKVIVTNEFGDKTERQLSYNIEQILTIENNIEEIEELIEKENKAITKSKKNMKSANTYMFLCFLWATTSILNAISGNIFSTILNIICSGCWGINAYTFNIKPNIKIIKTSESSISLLEKELDLQKEKLNNLQKEKNNNYNYVDTSKKNFTTSDKILELRNKLLIIEDYQHNKVKYMKLYKAGIIKGVTVWYNNNNLTFLEELIKNDLDNTKSKTKEKQKTLTK